MLSSTVSPSVRSPVMMWLVVMILGSLVGMIIAESEYRYFFLVDLLNEGSSCADSLSGIVDSMRMYEAKGRASFKIFGFKNRIVGLYKNKNY